MTVAEPQVDGRTARRERNREAVLDALLRHFDAGDLAPSLDAVAEEAGVSARSLFRYFDDGEDLTRAAIARQQERLAPLLAEPVPGGATTAERVAHAVDDRIALVVAMGNVGRVARMRAARNPAVTEELTRVRRVLRDRLAAALQPDLERPGDHGAEAELALAALDAALSFEAYHLLVDDQCLSHRQAVRAMHLAASAVVACGGSPGFDR